MPEVKTKSEGDETGPSIKIRFRAPPVVPDAFRTEVLFTAPKPKPQPPSKPANPAKPAKVNATGPDFCTKMSADLNAYGHNLFECDLVRRFEIDKAALKHQMDGNYAALAKVQPNKAALEEMYRKEWEARIKPLMTFYETLQKESRQADFSAPKPRFALPENSTKCAFYYSQYQKQKANHTLVCAPATFAFGGSSSSSVGTRHKRVRHPPAFRQAPTFGSPTERLSWRVGAPPKASQMLWPSPRLLLPI